MIYRIPFTQYELPDGRRSDVFFRTVRKEVEEAAKALIQNDFGFDVETLRTGEVSATVFDLNEDRNVAIVVAKKGPSLYLAIEEMILRTAKAKGTIK